MSTLSQKSKGILLMIMSALFLALLNVVVKLSGERIPLMEQVFFRNFVSFLVMFVVLRYTHTPLFGPKKYHPWLLMRSVFGVLGVICQFYASIHANQADVTTICKMSPFIVTLLAAVFLREKISRIQIPAMIMAFAGCIIVANPTFNSNTFPLFISFLDALTSAIAFTLLRFFRDKVDALTVVMFYSTCSTILIAPFALANFVVPTLYELVLLILLGILAALVQICLTYSYRMAPAAEVSVYNYSGIIFSMILGYFMLGQSVGLNSIIGGALVIAASLLVYFYNLRHDEAKV